MQHDFLPVVIRYDGMDADGHVIDLGLLGQSIQGASKLLGSAGSIVMTGQFAKKTKSMSVRVLAGQPEAHCWEIPAIITTVLVPAVAPMFPIIKEAATAAATKAVTAIVNYAISTVAGRTKEADMSRDIAIKFLEEMGHTPRTAIEAMERLATSQRPAIRMFVAPVGQSCSSARIVDPAFGSVTIDASMREAIDAPEEVEITDAQDFEILISEFDFRNRSCKLSMRDHIDDRITGEITDPIAQVAKNPYSTALDNQRWLCVRGKAQLKAGELEKLYISDLAPRSLPAPSIGG
ncbi:DUF7946 domain-containing protein [Tardiphaga sp. vice278]|uniref:DUF7946 domain-containing protein n=1 Tax=Tardiphaga sp. vice278 TaxID=2592815 RepID=UPI001164DDDC|nr:hypothetical protein [Tardiphaga sp. vice278]QDM18089.1 hypothetical protein FNL53_20700 [Tardiphaga sp. vice278]